MDIIPLFRDNFHMIHHVSELISYETGIEANTIIALVRINIVSIQTIKQYGIIQDYHYYREQATYGNGRSVTLGLCDRYNVDYHTVKNLLSRKKFYYTENYFKSLIAKHKINSR
jgi:hypothetical protein